MIIETDRLILREWRDEDREPMFVHLNSQPAVMEWLGGAQTREESDAGIDRIIGYQADYGHCFWAVERKTDAALLGFCGIKRTNDEGAPDPGKPEIGWRLRQDAWGRGYAKEAAVASMNYAFDTIGAEFVSAFTVKRNSGSWGLMERLGMTRRRDLEFWDPKWSPVLGETIVYRITAPEWAEKRQDFT